MADPSGVTVTLTADEALVLFELLHRWEDDKRVGSPQHSSEQVALWSLSALLERELVQPFDPGYDLLVAGARDRLARED